MNSPCTNATAFSSKGISDTMAVCFTSPTSRNCPISVVTGASGYVASELIRQLLERGHSVRGTVRNLSVAAKTTHLTKLAESQPGSLTLYAAELSIPGSFDNAIKGATYVFHVANPMNPMATDNPKRDVIDAALAGTKSIFDAVEKATSTVKKVVITSSIWCMLDLGALTLSNNMAVLTENDTNTVLDQEKGPAYCYAASKILAEPEAQRCAAKLGVPLVFINPSCILGPVLSPNAAGFSIDIMKGFVEGNTVMPTSLTGMKVDVRDVALAHIRAAESPIAQGRYIISQEYSFSNQAVFDTLQKRFPHLHFGDGHDNSAPHRVFDTEKARKELGIYVRPVEETIIDWALTLFQLGLASPVPKGR